MPQGEESGIGKKRLAAFPVAFKKGKTNSSQGFDRDDLYSVYFICIFQ